MEPVDDGERLEAPRKGVRLTDDAAPANVRLGGRRIEAEEALELGLIDEVVESDVVDAAVALAEKMAAEGGSPRRSSELEDRVTADRERPEIFEEYRKKMARKARGLESPYACVECIEAAVNKRFAEGLAFERETFARCVESAQSKALQHAFFAERESGKVPGVTKETSTRPIERAAVTAASPRRARNSASIPFAGASSITF